jgi:serine/threonine protein kinase
MQDDAFIALFLDRYLKDKEAGARRSLQAYQALFPGNEDLIAREFADLKQREAAHAEAREPDESRQGSASPSADRKVAGFRILRSLGRGGQGEVYLAEDSRLHRRVALKVLLGLGAYADEVLNRFKREAEITARLEHPGICAIHEAGIVDGVAYIAMRYIEGETLARSIATTKERLTSDSGGKAAPDSDRSGRKPEGAGGNEERLDITGILEAVRVAEKTARVLHVAHEAGIIHRDVKPGNIMITPSGDPVVLDFGLARDESSELTSLTRSGEHFGTPAYMSPEQLGHRAMRIDRRTDVWSLGVALFEALTMQRPFAAPTREALSHAILRENPVDARRLNPEIPKDLKVVLDTALEKERDRRYQTAEAFADDLHAVLEHRPVAAKPIGPVGRLSRWAAREPVKATLLATILIAIPVISTLIVLRLEDLPRVQAQRAAEAEWQKDELLARAVLQSRDLDDAISIFKTAMEVEGGSPEGAFATVLAIQGTGRTAEALQFLDAQAHLYSGRRAFVVLRRRLVRDLGRTEPEDAELPRSRDCLDHYLEGKRLTAYEEQDGRPLSWEEGLVEFMTAILLSKSPRIRYYLDAINAAGQAKDRRLIRALSEALRESWPAYQGTFLACGRAWAEVGETAQAIADFQEALRLGGPVEFGTRLSLGAIYAEKENWDEAIELFRAATVLIPGDVEAWCNLGAAFNKKGRSVDALAAFKEAVKQADVASSTRKWETAVSGYSSILDHESESPQACVGVRLKAARAAVQAARGAGAPGATATRQRALEWLRHEVHDSGAAAGTRRALEPWLSDPLFQPVRDDPAASALPPEEARAWKAFWTEVKALAQ